jgi:hypothetical protein
MSTNNNTLGRGVVYVKEHYRRSGFVVAHSRQFPTTQRVVAEDKKPVSLLKQFFLDAEELAGKQCAKDEKIDALRRACERHVAMLEAEKDEIFSQLEEVHGKQETWDSTHRAIFEGCKVYAARLNAYEKKRKAEKKAEGTFTKKAKASTPTTASASATLLLTPCVNVTK